MPASTSRLASRPTVIVGAAALVAVAAAALVAARVGKQAPPGFPLWRLRAGAPFSQLEQRVWLEQRRKFACRPIVGPHRLCEVASAGLPTTGVPGTVRALVDSAGVIASIQFRADVDTSRMVVQARRIVGDWYRDLDSLEAQWDSVAGVADGSRVVDRHVWATPDGRSSAWLLRDTPFGHRSAAAVADERSLARVRSSADLAELVLEEAGLDHSSAGGTLRRPLGPLTELGPAAPRRAVPVCPAQYRQPKLRPGDSTNGAPASHMRLLEQAIRLAYPGAKLVAGEDDLSLIRDGVPERLFVEPSKRSEDGELAVYAIRLPDRAEMAAVREAPGLAAECRAPTELLLVRVDTSGSAAETFRFVLDDEATIVRITDLEVRDALDPEAGFLVEYVATYDTAEWLAEVVWVATIHLREPRVLTRSPKLVGKKVKYTGEERVAEVRVQRSSSDRVRVSFLEPTPATKTVVVAHRRGEPFDMYKLLGQF